MTRVYIEYNRPGMQCHEETRVLDWMKQLYDCEGWMTVSLLLSTHGYKGLYETAVFLLLASFHHIHKCFQNGTVWWLTFGIKIISITGTEKSSGDVKLILLHSQILLLAVVSARLCSMSPGIGIKCAAWDNQ